MLAKLIVDSVSPEVTGVAMGMNTVMRTIGGVDRRPGGRGAAQRHHDPRHPGLPAESAFTEPS